MYTSLAANDFLVVFVASNHFDPGAYSNTTRLDLYSFITMPQNGTTNSHDFQQFTSMLEGHNTSTSSYEDLTPSHCANLYNRDFVSSHRNLFLITNHTSNATFDNTLLGMLRVDGSNYPQGRWMCPVPPGGSSVCDRGQVSLMAANKRPWVLPLSPSEEVEVRGCKSEVTDERCKVQFSLGIMMAVICCNLVKACAMIMTVVLSKEPTLVTLGDAIDSFLRIPDPTTRGICFADRRFIDREWKRGWRTGPRQWKQKGVQRWWTNVSKSRWITCNMFFAISIIVTAVLLRSGIRNDGWYGMKTDIRSM